MMRAALIAAAVAGVMVGVPLEQDQPNPERAIRQEVDRLTRAMTAAFGRGNLREVARYYADDATLYGPDGDVVRGRAQLDRFWGQFEEPISWTMTTVDVGGSSNQPHQLVESTLVFRDPAGHRKTSKTMCLFIWRRNADGRLRVHIDMYTHKRDS